MQQPGSLVQSVCLLSKSVLLQRLHIPLNAASGGRLLGLPAGLHRTGPSRLLPSYPTVTSPQLRPADGELPKTNMPGLGFKSSPLGCMHIFVYKPTASPTRLVRPPPSLSHGCHSASVWFPFFRAWENRLPHVAGREAFSPLSHSHEGLVASSPWTSSPRK